MSGTTGGSTGPTASLGLILPIKPRRRLKREKSEELAVPEAPYLVWSVDFMADRLAERRQFRRLNVRDDLSREGLGIEVNFSRPPERVVRSLNQIIEWRVKPLTIRLDNGPENVSSSLMTRAEKQGIAVTCKQRGKPQQNAYVERYSRAVLCECLDLHIRDTIEKVQQIATEGPRTYDNERPNICNGGPTRAMKLKKAAQVLQSSPVETGRITMPPLFRPIRRPLGPPFATAGWWPCGGPSGRSRRARPSSGQPPRRPCLR